MEKKKTLTKDAQRELIDLASQISQKFDDSQQTICMLYSTDNFRGYSFGGNLYELAKTLVAFLHRGFAVDTTKNKNLEFDEKFLFCVMYAIREIMNNDPLFKRFFLKFVNNEICTERPTAAELIENIAGIAEVLNFLSKCGSQCGVGQQTATTKDKKRGKRNPKNQQN